MTQTQYLDTLKEKRQAASDKASDAALRKATVEALQAVDRLSKSNLSQTQLKDLNSLKDGLTAIEKAVNKYQVAIDRQTVQLVAAINKLKLTPNITVPEPRVTVVEKAVDLQPLEKAIKGIGKPAVSLSDYRAHDIDDAPDGSQYIGFIAMDGSWYIAHTENNSMAYYFGTGSYAEAWDERLTHDYKPLNEAANALQA